MLFLCLPFVMYVCFLFCVFCVSVLFIYCFVYFFLSGRGHIVKTDNTSIERVEEFKYLGTTITDQNSIQEDWTRSKC